MAAIFGDILGPRKLRSVAAEEKNDSSNPKAGNVLCEETAHSREVEEHERAQVRDAGNRLPVSGASGWSTAYSAKEEADDRPEPNRAFREELARRLGQGIDTSTTGTSRGSGNSLLTAGSRTSMSANVSRKLQDESISTCP